KLEKNVWYDLVYDGLAGCLTEQVGSDGNTVRRLESVQAEPVEDSRLAARQSEPAALPDWARSAARPERARLKLAPSHLAFGLAGGAEGLPPEQPPLGPLALSKDGRYARGRLVHALLQHLPEVEPADQEQAARAFVAARGT